MGMIMKDYTVTGNSDSAAVRVLYDTGAGASFVRRDVAEPLGMIVPTPTPISFTMTDGQEVFTVDQAIYLDLDVDGTRLAYTFYVVNDLAEELIIGADMMQRWKISLDQDNETVED
jgi:predicted aspartyl protease